MKEEVKIQWQEEVDSTNSEALRHISELDNLTVLAAVHQTAGRGQRGNSWLTGKGENLTFSLVVKFDGGAFPPLKASRQFELTRRVTLGVADYLDSKGIGCAIKWPNDIYVRNKKICGMLIENILNGTFVAASVIGIGLNVNQMAFPPQLVNPVSMAMVSGDEYDLKAELPLLSRFIVDRLAREESGDEYVSRLYRIDSFCEYVICSTGRPIRAKIVGVSESGRLRLVTEKGEPLEFAFKEISFVI